MLPVLLYRWRPLPIPAEPIDFVRGLFTMCGAGRCATGSQCPCSAHGINQRRLTVAEPPTAARSLSVPGLSEQHARAPAAVVLGCAEFPAIAVLPAVLSRRLVTPSTCTQLQYPWMTAAWLMLMGTCSLCHSKVGPLTERRAHTCRAGFVLALAHVMGLRAQLRVRLMTGHNDLEMRAG